MPPHPQEVALVAAMVGESGCLPAGGGGTYVLAKRKGLLAGDEVRTGRSGRICLKLIGGTRLTANHSTELVVQGPGRVGLTKGEVVVLVPEGASLVIATVDGTVTAGRAGIDVRRDVFGTHLAVLEGSAACGNERGQVTVQAGRRCLLRRGMGPTSPAKGQAKSILAWVDAFYRAARWELPLDDLMGDLADWSLAGGKWSVAKPGLRQGCPKDQTIASTGDLAWRDYSFEVKIRPVAGNGRAGVIFRAREEASGARSLLRGRGTSAALYCWLMRITRDGSPGTHELLGGLSESWQGPSLQSGRWNTIRVVARGNVFELYLDERAVRQVCDAVAPVMSGKVGLVTERAIAHFADLKVNKVQGVRRNAGHEY